MFTKCKLYEIHLIRHAFGKVFFGARRLCLLNVYSIFMVIRNPGNDWNVESTHWQWIRNPQPRIQNPILSWITLINYSTWVESYVWTNVFLRNSRHNAWTGISFLPFLLKQDSFWAFIYTKKSWHVDLQLTCSCWMISRGSSELAIGRPSVVAPLKLSVRIMLISAQTSFKVKSAWRCK